MPSLNDALLTHATWNNPFLMPIIRHSKFAGSAGPRSTFGIGKRTLSPLLQFWNFLATGFHHLLSCQFYKFVNRTSVGRYISFLRTKWTVALFACWWHLAHGVKDIRTFRALFFGARHIIPTNVASQRFILFICLTTLRSMIGGVGVGLLPLRVFIPVAGSRPVSRASTSVSSFSVFAMARGMASARIPRVLGMVNDQ